MGKTKWRSEPTNVEKLADELWLGVKCQSNSELAGSPRNVLRRSGSGSLVGVKHCFAAGWETGTKARQTLNTAKKTRFFGLSYAIDGSYKGWNPYRERHWAIFVNCFLSKAN